MSASYPSLSPKIPVFAICVAMLLAWGATSLLFPYGPEDKEAISVRHWEQYGVWNLKAAFVIKPGPLTSDEIASPPRFRGHFLFAALPYHFIWSISINPGLALLVTGWVMILTVFAALWQLPCDAIHKIAAFCAIWTCPGVLREFLSLDPVPASLFWSLPALLWLASVFLRSADGIVLPAAVIAASAAMCLNWTSGIALAVWSPLFLWLIYRSRWRTSLLAGFAVVGLASASVFGFLLLDKIQFGGASAQAADYLSGAGKGYGAHASWGLALKRIVVSCGMGLLPLWLCLLYYVWPRRRKSPGRLVLCLLPTGLSVLLVLILRNYAAHAQWAVAVPIVLHGLVASITMFLASVGLCEDEIVHRPGYGKWFFVGIAGCALYAAAFLVLFSAFGAQTRSCYGYVLQNTSPQDAVLVENYNPTFGRRTDSGFLMDLSHQLGRECVASPGAAAEELLKSGRRCFLFTTSRHQAKNEIPRVSERDGLALLRPFFTWYQTRVSGRSADALSDPANHWILYEYAGASPR